MTSFSFYDDIIPRCTLFKLQEPLEVFGSEPLALGGVEVEESLHLDHSHVIRLPGHVTLT